MSITINKIDNTLKKNYNYIMNHRLILRIGLNHEETTYNFFYSNIENNMGK